ncbi:MAG: biotin--[acetyl-CoA-carboxylase] ligase [Candidatus Rokubacteria bacterium]|nr:biotin--[acetyl-CoA-carboxylase] ligase [Candidatus Rokubacteria bacterium]
MRGRTRQSRGAPRPPDPFTGPEPARASHCVLRLREVDSTQTFAFELAAHGAPDGTVVVADFQRQGRGRRGHAWTATPATSVLASILIRPRVAVSQLPLYSFVAAVAVADALESVANVDVRLKWPNDALVRERKIAGILLESRISPATPPAERVVEERPGCPGALPSAGGVGAMSGPAVAERVPEHRPGGAGPVASDGGVWGAISGPPMLVVIGIGINVRQSEFGADLCGRATSLFLETGHDVDRDVVLDAVLDALDRWRARFESEGFAPVRARWLDRALTIGRRVRIDDVEGVAVDIGMDGALVVADGAAERRISAGEVVEVARAERGRASC